MQSKVHPVSLQDGQRGPKMPPGNRHEGMNVVTIDPNAVLNTRGRFQYSGNPTFQASKLPGGPSPAERISELVVTPRPLRGAALVLECDSYGFASNLFAISNHWKSTPTSHHHLRLKLWCSTSLSSPRGLNTGLL